MNKNLIWIDLEMSGLNPEQDRILEMAAIITDENLEVLAESEILVIKQSPELLASMNEWCQQHHRENGLIEKVLASNLNEAQAEEQMLEFVSKYCAPNSSPLCGNSIWQDRRFLCRYMPHLESFFHYRTIDVSSIKELVARWYPSASKYEKTSSHRALDDISPSISELRFYRQNFFIKN